jgi:hypothetical protein
VVVKLDIHDAKTPLAKLVPIEQPELARVLGTDRGKICFAPDAFDPLTGDDLAVWSGALFPEPPKRQPPAPSPHRRRRRVR